MFIYLYIYIHLWIKKKINTYNITPFFIHVMCFPSPRHSGCNSCARHPLVPALPSVNAKKLQPALCLQCIMHHDHCLWNLALAV